MDLVTLQKQQIEALQKENQLLHEQIQKVIRESNYFMNSTKEYMAAKEKNDLQSIQLKKELFQKHIERLREPQNDFDVLLRNFYYYLIQYLEIELLRKMIRAT